MTFPHRLLGLLAGIALLLPFPLQARVTPVQETPEMTLQLLSAVEGTGVQEAFRLGLHVRLNDPWKSYWRSPGDAGLPPEVDLSASENVASVTLDFPTPDRMEVLGFQTFGYKQEVIYPLTVRPEVTGAPVVLKGTLSLMVCSDTLCVPGQFPIDLTIPQGMATATEHARAIDIWRSRVPIPAQAAGFTVQSLTVSQDASASVLTAVIESREPLEAPDIYFESKPLLSTNPPEVDLSEDARTATLRFVINDPPEDLLTLGGMEMRLTLVDRPEGGTIRAGDVTVPLGLNTLGTAPDGSGVPSLAFILLAALLGGLILNVMPCVLPVLSMKLMSAVKYAGATKQGDSADAARTLAKIRIGFLASAAGIVSCFLLIALVLIALKLAGHSIGWGIQFQEPLFLVFLMLVVVAFAFNMLGLFEIILPSSMNQKLYAVGGEGTAGHFLTGMVATLLATPCSAPFLGTAVGYALAQGPLTILLIFLFLGVGLAIPYLLVAARPVMATKLPRPGKWMAQVKGFFGLVLVATALWLAWILSDQIGVALAVIVLIIALGMGALLSTALGSARWKKSPARLALIPAAIVLALALPATARPPEPVALELGWTRFDEAAIPSLIGEGRTVFVDVTASWCLTCKVNKAFIVDSEAITQAFDSQNVVLMQADWTNPDQTILDYLQKHGRYGIPFNMVYGPNATRGLPLPELLTETAVLEALDKANGVDR